MTSNEAELIERLIAEAAKRGTVEELMRQAVKAGEDAAMQAKDRNAAAEVIRRRASVSIDASLAALRGLFLATRHRHKNRKAFHNAMLNAADYLESQRPF